MLLIFECAKGRYLIILYLSLKKLFLEIFSSCNLLILYLIQGEAVLFAPRRGDTFDKFVDLASQKFETQVKENYDDTVWDIHCKVCAEV